MNLLRSFLIWLMLLLAAGASSAQATGQGEWISYRDAYRSMLWFEKYGQPKHLIQAHFRIMAGSGALAMALPAQLTLSGKTVHLNLPLDETGRTSLPLLKQAYDENAELQLPQALANWRFGTEISIALRADGMYDLAQLRAACQQVQAYQNWRDASLLRGKKCSGVRFVYGKKNAPATLTWRKADAPLPAVVSAAAPAAPGPAALALTDGTAFGLPGEPAAFRVANAVFASLPDKAQILTPGAPLLITALFE